MLDNTNLEADIRKQEADRLAAKQQEDKVAAAFPSLDSVIRQHVLLAFKARQGLPTEQAKLLGVSMSRLRRLRKLVAAVPAATAVVPAATAVVPATVEKASVSGQVTPTRPGHQSVAAPAPPTSERKSIFSQLPPVKAPPLPTVRYIKEEEPADPHRTSMFDELARRVNQ